MILFNIFLTKKTIRPGRCPGANRFFGGETGIRTRDTTFAVYSLSRRAPSTYSAISPEYFNRLASGPYFYLDVKSFDQIRRTRCGYKLFMAEGVGFEPTSRCRETVFKTAAFDHSAIPPVEFIFLASAEALGQSFSYYFRPKNPEGNCGAPPGRSCERPPGARCGC